MMQPDTTPTAVLMARDALSAMSETQRIALALEIVNGVRSEHSAWHLMRVGSLATTVAGDLAKVAFEKECG